MSLLFHIVKFKNPHIHQTAGGITLNSILKKFRDVIRIFTFCRRYLLLRRKYYFIFVRRCKNWHISFPPFHFYFHVHFLSHSKHWEYSCFLLNILQNQRSRFLLTNPISFTKIFLIKFFDNFFYSSSTLLLIVAAAISAYVSYSNYNGILFRNNSLF